MMEMKRTKWPGEPVAIITPKRGRIVKYPHYYKQWAGFLPFPPEECPFAERIYTDRDSGIQWLDLAFCASGKCGSKPCARRNEYSHAEWRSEYFRLKEIEAGVTKGRRTR